MPVTEKDDYKNTTITTAQRGKTYLNCVINGFFTIMWLVWMFIPKNDCWTLPGSNCEDENKEHRVNCEAIANPTDEMYANLEK